MRTALRLAHLWVGLVLCLLLVVLGVTGSALTYKEAYWRLVYPELQVSGAELDAGDHAAGIQAATEAFGPELRSVKLPEPGVGAYHLYLADGEAFLSVDDGGVIDRWRTGERAMGFLFDLHAHLMAGETGERIGGVLGLLGALLVLSGVYLWWPARRRFRLRNLVRGGTTRPTLLAAHRDLGLVSAPLLLILLVTAWGIVFYGTAGTLLNGLLPGDEPVPEALSEEAIPAPVRTAAANGTGRGDLAPADAALLARGFQAIPDARPVFYYPPTVERPVHGLRLKRPCELHPNGRSYVYLDMDGGILGYVDACAQPAGQKALYAIYPLHAGKAGSELYRLLVFLGGMILTWISATGACSYLAQLLTRRRRSRERRTVEGAATG